MPPKAKAPPRGPDVHAKWDDRLHTVIEMKNAMLVDEQDREVRPPNWWAHLVSCS